ncbi:MAG TPA: hypothetical protein VE136_07550 [Anaerolineales bacterium]|nr:hypothetical protein [Anaerolineales bacterium]
MPATGAGHGDARPTGNERIRDAGHGCRAWGCPAYRDREKGAGWRHGDARPTGTGRRVPGGGTGMPAIQTGGARVAAWGCPAYKQWCSRHNPVGQ